MKYSWPPISDTPETGAVTNPQQLGKLTLVARAQKAPEICEPMAPPISVQMLAMKEDVPDSFETARSIWLTSSPPTPATVNGIARPCSVPGKLALPEPTMADPPAAYTLLPAPRSLKRTTPHHADALARPKPNTASDRIENLIGIASNS